MKYRTQPRSFASIMGGIIESKATEYRGIEMRSRLEADFARSLDDRGLTWSYEPRPFFANGRGYLPDFMVERPDGYHFIEVKPTLGEVPEAKRRMTVIWNDYPTAVLIVACAQECRWFACERGGQWSTWVDRWKHAEAA